MSSNQARTIEAILKNNPFAKGRFQFDTTNAILKNGKMTTIEIQEVNQKNNPQRTVSFFRKHRVFEVLTKKGVIKPLNGNFEKTVSDNDGAWIMPYYAELEANEIPRLRALAKRIAKEYEESK